MFDAKRFRDLAEQSPIIGEIGLDTGSRVPLEVQQKTFRQALEIAADLRRPVSIHSYAATRLVLEELRRTPVPAPILHWWTGVAEETRYAVALGCYFSIHSQVARRSIFHTIVPPDRMLIESDHGFNDPPPAIPSRVQWVEYLVSQQLDVSVQETRHLAWHNLGRILRETGTLRILPGPFAAVFEGKARETPARFSRTRGKQENLLIEH
jgi:TatD DNase family protein